MTREVSRPSGSPPPAEAQFGMVRVPLVALAEETARRHLLTHPEDATRYGDLAREWAVHDMQHVLAWAFGDAGDLVELGEQVGWLARVLDARGYPLGNLSDCLVIAADVVAEQVADGEGVAARLREVAEAVRPQPRG